MPDQPTKEKFLRRAIEISYETFESGLGQPVTRVQNIRYGPTARTAILASLTMGPSSHRA